MANLVPSIQTQAWAESGPPARLGVKLAQEQAHNHRQAGWEAFAALFQQGRLPAALKGSYAGSFVAFNLGPGVSAVLEGFTWAWRLWKGKFFQAELARGDNLLDQSFLPLARWIWPFYHGYRPGEDKSTWHGFPFHTWKGPSLADAGQAVLKVDYNLPANPAFTVRRVLDELVELEPGYYLGKWNFYWGWDRWQTLAYFTLAAPE